MYNGRCTGSVNFMVFETENAIFESFINVAQIEITGKCNLKYSNFPTNETGTNAQGGRR